MPELIDLRTKEPQREAHEEEPPQTLPPEEERHLGELLSWTGTDASSREKSPEWYWVLAIFVFAFVCIGVVFENFVLSLLAIMSGASLALIGSRGSYTVHAAITTEGIVVEDKLHRYEDLQSFWIFYDPPHLKELSLKSKHLLSTHVRIPLGDVNPTIIHEALRPFLKEVREEEAFADILARHIGL